MNARQGLRGCLLNNAPTPVLLSYATILTFALYPAMPLLQSLLGPPGLIMGYLPFGVGASAMWLCFVAHHRSKHRRAVIIYMFLLAPFAFYYPVIWIYLLYTEATGQYHGPYP